MYFGDLRLDLPARPVLPDRAGLLAARGRPADAALDRRCRCSSRRSPALLSDRHRLAAADGDRPGAAGDRDRLAGGRSRRRRRLQRRSSPAFVMAGTGMALVFAPAANAVLGAVRPEEAGQASGATNAIRELGGVLGVAVLASVFAGARRLRVAAGVHVDGMTAALSVGAAVLGRRRADRRCWSRAAAARAPRRRRRPWPRPRSERPRLKGSDPVSRGASRGLTP